MRVIGRALLVSALVAAVPAFAADQIFIPGNLVVAVEGAGVWGAPAAPALQANAAAPLTLMQFSHTGTTSAAYVNSLVLPQTAGGGNNIVSGEYGSSSEGFLHLSADNRFLTIAGYGVNAAAFNAAVNSTDAATRNTYGSFTNNPSKGTALGQSGSLQNAGYTPVARTIATIDMTGYVDSSTALYGVFNGNNPRSVATVDGKSFYVSGQGLDPDTTGGVFWAQHGASSATPITGKDTQSLSPSNSPFDDNQDTRDIQIYKNQLYVSVDSKGGKNNARSFIGTLGTQNNLPTSVANNEQGPTQLNNFGTTKTGKYSVTAATGNGLNVPAGSSSSLTINLSPEEYFFASDTVLYVADSGFSKQDSANQIGDGGLQKWVKTGNTWSLVYTLSNGLSPASLDPAHNVVANNNITGNANGTGTTGLFGLTGQVNADGTVDLYATNYTNSGLEQTYLYGITDTLTATTKGANQSFTVLAAAPTNSIFKGVSFAPSVMVPEPGTWALMLLGFGGVGVAARSRRAKLRAA